MVTSNEMLHRSSTTKLSNIPKPVQLENYLFGSVTHTMTNYCLMKKNILKCNQALACIYLRIGQAIDCVLIA